MLPRRWILITLLLFFLLWFISQINFSFDGAIWPKEITEISIESSFDGELQNAFVYYSSKKKQPIVVSLHTWDGDYTQFDSISILSIKKDINYIHPNFRGSNKNSTACCSAEVISDIDDAIEHLLLENDADASNIYVIGVSGGGYATLCSYFKSKYTAKKYSAWASISDLEEWYHQSQERNNGFDQDILACIDLKDFKSRSPINWTIPKSKLVNSKLVIYAGIHDGFKGSVPITHSIRIYNKIAQAIESNEFVTPKEENLLLHRKGNLGEFGHISGRKVHLFKSNESSCLTIFEGGHEMPLPFAFEDLFIEPNNF